MSVQFGKNLHLTCLGGCAGTGVFCLMGANIDPEGKEKMGTRQKQQQRET